MSHNSGWVPKNFLLHQETEAGKKLYTGECKVIDPSQLSKDDFKTIMENAKKINSQGKR